MKYKDNGNSKGHIISPPERSLFKFRYLWYIISELPIARRTTTIKGIKQKWKEVRTEVRGKTISLQC